MPNSNLKTEEGIIQMIADWETASSNSESLLWDLAWRIGSIDSDKERSKVRAEWCERASDANVGSLKKAVGGAAKIIRLNDNKVPNKTVKARIQKNGATYVGQFSGRLNADILTAKGKNVTDCLDPAKKKSKSTPELISGEAPTVENVGLLLGQCIVAATDSDPRQLCENVITIAMAYVAEVKNKAKK